MRKRVLFAVVALTVVLCAGDIYANIDSLSNMSVEWIRTGNRNAATDAADIVEYNPGGITELPDGFQVNIGNQTLWREPEHEFDLGMGKQSFEQDGADPFLPNVYVTFNKDDWAAFGAFNIVGGGATVDYPDGSITTHMVFLSAKAGPGGDALTGFKNDYLEAESAYYTFTIGGAYEFCDYFSAALGVRYLYADNSIKAGTTLIAGTPPASMDMIKKVDFDETGDGVGFVFGFNINPTEKMNIGVHYLSKIGLDLETDVNRDDILGLTDGQESARDYPARFGIGIGYDISDKFYGEINYSYWFQEDCDWGTDDLGRDVAEMAGDAYSVGITFSYKFTDKILVSIGTTYTDFLWNDIDGYYAANLGSYEVLYTDNWHVGVGGCYEVMEGVKFNLGLARTIWEDKDFTVPTNINTQNATTVFAVGVNVEF